MSQYTSKIPIPQPAAADSVPYCVRCTAPQMMPEILRVHHVLQLIPISRSTLWRWVDAGYFPPPVRLGGPESRAIGWLRTVVEEWIRNRRLTCEKS